MEVDFFFFLNVLNSNVQWYFCTERFRVTFYYFIESSSLAKIWEKYLIFLDVVNVNVSILINFNFQNAGSCVELHLKNETEKENQKEGGGGRGKKTSRQTFRKFRSVKKVY